jgi:hypothetical protein
MKLHDQMTFHDSSAQAVAVAIAAAHAATTQKEGDESVPLLDY